MAPPRRHKRPLPYTRQQVDEMNAWFAEHKAELPPSLRLNNYCNFVHLPLTVDYLIEVAYDHQEHMYFGGYFRRLQEIRQKLIEDGYVK